MIIQIIVALLLLAFVIIDFVSKKVTNGTFITIGILVVWAVISIIKVFFK